MRARSALVHLLRRYTGLIIGQRVGGTRGGMTGVLWILDGGGESAFSGDWAT